MAPCKFKSSWLCEKDCNDVYISSWAKEYDSKHIYCKVCEKKIPVVGGIAAIKQHSQGKKHNLCLKNKCSGGQLQLQVITPATVGKLSHKTCKLIDKIYTPCLVSAPQNRRSNIIICVKIVWINLITV